MGQVASALDGAEYSAAQDTGLRVNEGTRSAQEAELRANPLLKAMVGRPPLHCMFYYETQAVSGQLQLPLVYDKVEGDMSRTRLMDLELWLREQFCIPIGSSVFAVVPAEELYSPPYPLVMINTIAGALYRKFEDERVPVLQLALVVRHMALLRQPVMRADAQESPYYPVSAAALAHKDNSIARQFARARFVRNMQQFGFARLEVSPEQARIPELAFASVRAWLARQLALPSERRWRDRVDVSADDDAGISSKDTATTDVDATDASAGANATRAVSKGRFVGFSADRNREFLQLRRPIAASGTVWPPAYFDDDRLFATEMLQLLELLDALSRDCMRAICEMLNLDTRWVLDELLDNPTPPPATTTTDVVDKSYQYGASVLRIYNYRNKTRAAAASADGSGSGSIAEPPRPPLDDPSCAVHADLGLVTVSPVATVPGLQMWNLERMLWTDVEEDAGPMHFSVFAGETLGFLTKGLIKAPLHRVPATCVSSEAERRMSMPYFLRVRPEQCLNPRAEPAMQMSCRDFMEDIVFKKRPWRREDKSSGLDY